MHAQEAPSEVADGGDHESPPIDDLVVEDDGGDDRGDDVAEVLRGSEATETLVSIL